jgi:hypothetical protein
MSRAVKVKSIRLVASAQACAARIGEASKLTSPAAVRFAKRELLDSGSTVWRHHARSTYER